MKNVLYLGSKSKSRQMLLEAADISYQILDHDADECRVSLEESFEDYVSAIALEKMRHVKLPSKVSHEYIFVLTADSLVQTIRTKQMLGKPKDKDDAKRMIRILRNEPALVVTGCCLEKKQSIGKGWKLIEKKSWVTSAVVEFCVGEEFIDIYLEKVPLALYACCGAVIEGYGGNFLKSIHGSYSTARGLPMYELLQQLKTIGFFN